MLLVMSLVPRPGVWLGLLRHPRARHQDLRLRARGGCNVELDISVAVCNVCVMCNVWQYLCVAECNLVISVCNVWQLSVCKYEQCCGCERIIPRVGVVWLQWSVVPINMILR